MNLQRGSHGFIGSRIKERFNCTEIPRSLAIPSGKYDTLFYCAGYGNMHWQSNPVEIWKVNFNDLVTLVPLMQKINIVYFSTSNGNKDYLESKRKAEYFADVVVRPYSVTGVGEQARHLIPTIIDCAFTGKTLTLDPEPVHDFIDIDDLLDAVDLVKDKPGIYDVGTGTQWSNQEIVRLVEMVTKKKIKVELVKNMRPYDKIEWKANPSALWSLGWTPKKNLIQTITEMVKTYDKE